MTTTPHTNSSDILTLLRHTPMRDVLRLRLTGRLNVRAMIKRANLPPQLADTVLLVARRTHLSRVDKADVAAELITHFADGLEAGNSAQQLLNDFGDPERAARLIRRAKRRNHTALQRLPRYTLNTIGILVLLYLVAVAYFIAGSPNPSHDYVADFNRVAAAAAPDQSAWPLYRKASLMLEEPPQFDLDQYHDYPSKPGDPQWDLMRQYLLRQQDAFALARAGSALPYLGYISSSTISEADAQLWPDLAKYDNAEHSLLHVNLRYLGNIRQLAVWLLYDAQRAAEDADEQTTLANILAALNLARHTREHSTLINQLVEVAILQRALDTTASILHQRPEVFSDQTLQNLSHQIVGLYPDAIRIDLSYERMWFYDTVQRVYTDNGRGNGRITAEGVRRLMAYEDSNLFKDLPERSLMQNLAMPATSLVIANRRNMVAKYEQILSMAEREASKPLWERTNEPDQRIMAMSDDFVQYTRYWPALLLAPTFSRITEVADRATLTRDGALAIIAMHLHRRQHGTWPESLDQLVPHMLPSVPIDQYDGQPLRYVLRDGQPVLYSVDTNRIDDGGHFQPRLHPAEPPAPTKDLILWPPMD